MDLSEFSHLSETSLMWRSKPSRSQTWSQRWKRVSWMRALSGRTLRPSHSQTFTERWTSSLEATLANPSALQGREKERTTPDTFSLILQRESEQQDLLFASSRTWKDTYRKGLEKFNRAYAAWVTELRQEYSQRQKSVHHTSGKGSSFSAWRTPCASEGEGGIDYNYDQVKSPKIKLRDQVAKNWGTPNTMDCLPSRSYEAMKNQATNGGRKNRERPGNLREQVDPLMCQAYQEAKKEANFPTPTARDGTGTNSPADRERNSPGLPSFIPELNSQPDQTNPSTSGKNQELNPKWVEQLMGLPVEWTSFDSSEMESSQTPQN